MGKNPKTGGSMSILTFPLDLKIFPDRFIQAYSDVFLCQRRDMERIPKWFMGYAYRRWDLLITVYALMPFNFIIQFVNYIKFRYNKWRSKPSIVDHYVISEVKHRINSYWDLEEVRAKKIARALYDIQKADKEATINIKNFRGLCIPKQDEENHMRTFEFYAKGMGFNDKGEIVLLEEEII